MNVVQFNSSRKRSAKVEAQIGQIVEYRQWRDLISRELQIKVANKTTMKSISAQTGLCVSTISRLVSKETQFPRMETIMLVLRYLGYRLYAEKIA